MNFIAKIVGKNIRVRREALGLSQSALSKLAKVSNVTISRIEAGTQAPQAISVDLIAAALGCTVEDLYASPQRTLSDLAKGNIEPPPPPPQTFTIEEMRAAIREEIKASLEVERLRAENTELKSQQLPPDLSEAKRNLIRKIINMPEARAIGLDRSLDSAGLNQDKGTPNVARKG